MAAVGGICLAFGVVGLLIFLPRSDLANAAGSGVLTLLGLVLGRSAHRRRADRAGTRPDRDSPGGA